MTLTSRTIEKQERRARREAELGRRQRELPDKRYGVILADPPWRFEPYSRVTGMDRAADNHYPTSPLDEIKALSVKGIAATDSVLFLWATVPMLPQALDVMAAWGFAYKSSLAWAKDHVGTGYWVRNKHELLLIGTRGSVPAPAAGDPMAIAHRSARRAPLREARGLLRDHRKLFPDPAQDRASRARRRRAEGLGRVGAGGADRQSGERGVTHRPARG
jgi:N6-adenosine-specific RNA methylase IME4